jgi:hypothetical protein
MSALDAEIYDYDAGQFKKKGIDTIVKWITQEQSYRCPNCLEIDAGLEVAPYLFRFPTAKVPREGALSITDGGVTMIMAKCRHCQHVTLYAAADIFQGRREGPVHRRLNMADKLVLDTLHEFAVATPPDGVRRVGLIMRGSPVVPAGEKTPEARWAMSPEQANELSAQLAQAATSLDTDGDLLFPDHRELEKAAINFISMVGIALRRLDQNSSDVSSKWFLEQLSDVLERQTGRRPQDDADELRRLHQQLIYAVNYGRAQG